MMCYYLNVQFQGQRVNAVRYEIAIHSENYAKHINLSVGRMQRQTLEVKVEVVYIVTTLL